LKIYETIDNIVNPKDGIIAMCSNCEQNYTESEGEANVE